MKHWDNYLLLKVFHSIDDIKDSSAESLMKIEGIEEDTAKAFDRKSKRVLPKRSRRYF